VTAPADPDLAAVMVLLAGLPDQLAGRDGKAIRLHVERLAQILAVGPGGGDAADAELRTRAAAELDQLIGAIARLATAQRGAAHADAVRGIDLRALAAGLRTFVEYLRAPTSANQAEVAGLVATLQGVAMPPVPLDELRIDGTVAELAVESARRRGLAGAELRHAVERMKREMSTLVRQLELRAEQEASRARAAAELERLFDAVVGTGTPLGHALAPERAAVVQAFRGVDLAHMAEGLGVFAVWLSTPAEDPAAHVVELRARLAEALGPPTTGDPARSEAERRADFEREIQVAIDQIFRGAGPA